MLWTLIWLAGVLLGYAIFMSQTPLRGYFSDAFGLIRERGCAHVWILAGTLSLAGAGVDVWRHYEDGGSYSMGSVLSSPELREVATDIPARGGRMVGEMFSTIADGGRTEIGGGVRGVMVGLLGSLLVVSAALVLQYYMLLFLYVRISSPSRRIKLGKLCELSLRRFGRTWPLLPICWLLWAMPLVGGITGVAATYWWLGAALFFVVFAFVQVGVLSGERDLRAVVAFNFDCWREGGFVAIWFIVIAFLNLSLFTLGEMAFERSIALGESAGAGFEVGICVWPLFHPSVAAGCVVAVILRPLHRTQATAAEIDFFYERSATGRRERDEKEQVEPGVCLHLYPEGSA